jgi:hypothetical protein
VTKHDANAAVLARDARPVVVFRVPCDASPLSFRGHGFTFLEVLATCRHVTTVDTKDYFVYICSMTTKQKSAAAAAIVAAAAAWITWPKIFVLVAIIAVLWLSVASCVAVIVGRIIAAREANR